MFAASFALHRVVDFSTSLLITGLWFSDLVLRHKKANVSIHGLLTVANGLQVRLRQRMRQVIVVARERMALRVLVARMRPLLADNVWIVRVFLHTNLTRLNLVAVI